MRDPALDKLISPRPQRGVPFDRLMQQRVRNVLLVSSLYDSFTFEEDAGLTGILFSEYLELHMRYAPNVVRVSSAPEALRLLRSGPFDLVITMLRIGGMDLFDFWEGVRDVAPGVPVLLLAYNARELQVLSDANRFEGIDKPFIWLGDVRLFLAMTKYVEDRLNFAHDVSVAGVQSIIVVEDSVRFYSAYLPMLYTELVRQSRAVMADGFDRMQKLLRMRARPKILLATTFEEAAEFYEREKHSVLGVITDATFPRGGVKDPGAGLAFAQLAKSADPDLPVLVQSTDSDVAPSAEALGCSFLNKKSPALLAGLREFMLTNLGFGDFVFKRPDGTVVAEAPDLRTFIQKLATIPDESLLYHARRNHFSRWLAARTEFDLSRAIRPRKVSEFETSDDVRDFLVASASAHRERRRTGVVADFSQGTFDDRSPFVRIGEGSFGGKGRGLAFINRLFGEYNIQGHFPGIRLFVPPSAAVTTEVFEEFVAKDGLLELALGDVSDDLIATAFLRAELPQSVVSALRTFLERVRYPLAVRSSSLLEDAYYQPFAGIYETFMVPNNHPNTDVRLRELCNAIKLVYASTYFENAKAYLETTPSRPEEEKMAIIIQQLVARRHGQYEYPDFAGSARSINFYPMRGMHPEDGIASVALGLGRQVVDGGKCVRFSPRHKHRLYQFSSTDDTLRNAQREFFALDMSAPGPRWTGEQAHANIVKLGLAKAIEHGTLRAVGSMYSPDDDRVVDGINRKNGYPLVTMAGVLKHSIFPLAEVLDLMLQIGNASMRCPVEIEFAVNLRKRMGKPDEFGFLQIRPVVLYEPTMERPIDSAPCDQALVVSRSALGHGRFENMRDIVYVNPATFDRAKTQEIAREVGNINRPLKNADRPYVLVGPGRWGSADRWLGIPVGWRDINGAQAVVETDMVDIRVEPSQGTHFFHNITSFGLAYLTIHRAGGDCVDYDWLQAQPAATETKYVRHVAFPEPFQVIVDNRTRFGAVMKPGYRLRGRGTEGA